MLTKMRHSFLFNSIILILIKVTLCDETAEVKLKQGVLLGKADKTFLKQQDYYSFKGVPFAAPPIGELRFKPPKSHEGWEGPYEAYTNKPTCPQFNGRMRNGEPFGASGTEDCLYLSIFTPDLKGSAPVVVFDYSDNFRLGFNGSETYSPEFFVEEDVIVVTISHRLGLFGYLTTEDEVIPANAGLKDFILGLNWIKDNIENFGGDPNRVTLMGTRGGAALANILMYSNKAKGLFSGAIMQSGTSFESVYFYSNPREKAYKLAEILEIKADDSKTLLQELQKVDTETLLKQEIYVIDSENLKKHQISVHPFAPIIEKEHPDAALTSLPEDGKFVNDVPIIIGFNSRDGLDLVSIFLSEPRMLKEISPQSNFLFPIRTSFRFDRNGTMFEEIVSDINDFYLEDGYLHTHNILEYAVRTGDELQIYAIDYAAKKMKDDLESSVFYYMFDYRGSLNENSEHLMRHARFSLGNHGATITDELCYLHLCSRIRNNYVKVTNLVSEQAEIKVLKNMVRLWTNFAKTRNPTPKPDDSILKDFVWKPITKQSSDTNYLHITKTLKMRTNPMGDRAPFWDKLLDKYSKMAVDGIVRQEAHDEL